MARSPAPGDSAMRPAGKSKLLSKSSTSCKSKWTARNRKESTFKRSWMRCMPGGLRPTRTIGAETAAMEEARRAPPAQSPGPQVPPGTSGRSFGFLRSTSWRQCHPCGSPQWCTAKPRQQKPGSCRPLLLQALGPHGVRDQTEEPRRPKWQGRGQSQGKAIRQQRRRNVRHCRNRRRGSRGPLSLALPPAKTQGR